MQVRCTFPQWQAGLPECIDANAPTGRLSLNDWRGLHLTVSLPLTTAKARTEYYFEKYRNED